MIEFHNTHDDRNVNIRYPTSCNVAVQQQTRYGRVPRYIQVYHLLVYQVLLLHIISIFIGNINYLIVTTNNRYK